ncbi:MAG TPA: hypothetical protein VKB80_29895 [Kofleriaceae bacterium]|nr:hypothetical protein [Kofleriaceae bacterium]
MRAHQPIAKGKADATSRARMLIKSRLWWLDGFAGEGGWIALPLDGSREAGALALDRGHLRSAARAISELERDFPRALPRIVGDGARWIEASRRVLALVKPWVHSGEALPPHLLDGDLWPRAAREQARAIAGDAGALEPVVGALSWLLATRAAAAPRCVRWLARNREVVARAVGSGGRDRLVLALRLVYLGASAGEGLVAPLAALTGDAVALAAPLGDPWTVAAKAAVAIRPAARLVGRLPQLPAESDLAVEIAGWVAWLTSVDVTSQRRFLRLVAACDLPDLIAAWSGWWAQVRALLERVQLIERGRDRAATPEVLTRLRHSLERLAEHTPPAIDAGALGRSLRALSADASEPCVAPARAVLARLPPRTGLRAAFAAQWGARARDRAGVKQLARWLGHLRDHLAATGAAEAALAPLAQEAQAEAARAPGRPPPFSWFIDQLAARPPDHVKQFFAALAVLQARRPDAVTREVALRIDNLAARERDPALIAELAMGLLDSGEAGSWLSDEVARAALALCSGERAAFSQVVRALREIDQAEPGLPVDRLVDSLLPAFTDEPALLRELLIAGDRRAVIACGERLAALHAVGEPAPAPREAAAPAGWVDEFPPRLQPALRLLARSSADAEALARRAVGAAWKSPAALEEERAAVARELARASGERRAALEARRANLTRRIRHPAPPPERSLRKLEDKLRRRAALERLQALDAATGARMVPAAIRHFGLAGEPSWLAEPRVLRLLPAFAALPARDRALARELLRARAGPPPWDLRDHPANRTFLRRLESLGIDAAPWLDGIGAIERPSAAGALSFTLEADPLEVFHMGGHFRTCLSPGAENFFSVLANAADINKRVLFARTATGSVMGRRLVCLTRDGAMLVFHAYCHQESIDFDGMSGRIIGELAARMGTRLASSGQVPCLVASRWYDDGPDDITGQLAFLSDGSRFRQRLRDVAPAELPALLAAELGPGPVDAHVAPMLAGLPELAERPELACALVPVIRDRTHLGDEAVLRLATLLESAGSPDVAAELFGDALEHAARTEFRVHGWANLEPIELLCRIAPGRALHTLRHTRPDGARSWPQEKHADRLLAAASALDRLRRPAQSAALLRRAIEVGHPESAVVAARQRLLELSERAVPRAR